MRVEHRLYKCTACGHEKMISTNHQGECLDYCERCSWKANYAPSYLTPTHAHCRAFEYVNKETEGDQANKDETI